MDDKILGFFIYGVDETISDEFSEYLYGNNGINSLIEKELRNDYGKGVDLILISYFIDGPDERVDKQKKLSNLDKENSIAVHFNIRIASFHNKEHDERKKIIVNSILEGITDVQNKLKGNNKVKVDFPLLKTDFEKIASIYLDGNLIL